MAQYQYLCPECGPWTVVLPMGTAEAARSSPACGGRSGRQWTAPSLNLDRRLVRLRRQEEAGRDVPEVTTAIPPAARRRPAADPRHATLPRP